MNELTSSQHALPSATPPTEPPQTSVVPGHVNVSPIAGAAGAFPLAAAAGSARPPTDSLAIVSAICGLTAFIPVVSQIAGLVLGIIAVRRIRRARRAGLAVAGMGWAATGIASSVCVLLGWVFVVAVLGVAAYFFSNTATALDQAIPVPPR